MVKKTNSTLNMSLLITILAFFVSCSHRPVPKVSSGAFSSTSSENTHSLKSANSLSSERISRSVSSEDISPSELLDAHYESDARDMKLDYSDQYYKKWYNYFSNKDHERFERFLINAIPAYPVVKMIFQEEQLPIDLFFVGLIESGYYSSATSRAAAKGPWQFMSRTGKHYGLVIDRSRDDRLNLVLATRAAAKYFRDLYNIFGSWELALCGYNAGEYRIIKIIRDAGTRDYKELVRRKLLPKETLHYIPKMLAAREIFSQRASQVALTRVSEIQSKVQFLDYYQTDITHGIDFTKLQYQASMAPFKSQFAAANMHLKRRVIQGSSRNKIPLFVPGKIKEKIFLTLASNSSVKSFSPQRSKSKSRRSRAVASNSRKNYRSLKKSHTYRIRKGDTLGRIARKFSTTISDIKKINRMKSSKIFVGKKIIIPQNVADKGSSRRRPSS